jgi:hypothetical protein
MYMIQDVVLLGSDALPKYIQPPVIPGHEFVGEVTKLGPGIVGPGYNQPANPSLVLEGQGGKECCFLYSETWTL